MTDTLGITKDPQTCICRREPWVTVDMLGGIRPARLTGEPTVYCPDHDHCLWGAPLIDGRIGEHLRNMDPDCRWIGIMVAPARPCLCGGWPWVRAGMMTPVIHDHLVPVNPVKSVGCPGCRSMVDVERSRIVMHSRRGRESCTWSGIYVAVGTSVPPLGVKAPVSTRV